MVYGFYSKSTSQFWFFGDLSDEITMVTDKKTRANSFTLSVSRLISFSPSQAELLLESPKTSLSIKVHDRLLYPICRQDSNTK
jgi:hypothetical protein